LDVLKHIDMEDKELLDALQEMTKGYGNGWVLRESYRGRGMRLHESSRSGAKPTVREAIEDYIKNRNNDK